MLFFISSIFLQHTRPSSLSVPFPTSSSSSSRPIPFLPSPHVIRSSKVYNRNFPPVPVPSPLPYSHSVPASFPLFLPIVGKPCLSLIHVSFLFPASFPLFLPVIGKPCLSLIHMPFPFPPSCPFSPSPIRLFPSLPFEVLVSFHELYPSLSCLPFPSLRFPHPHFPL